MLFSIVIPVYNVEKYLDECMQSILQQLLNKNPQKRGMEYLVKIVLLSRCKYLVSSITMGSIAAYSMNGGKYEDEMIFDKGVYQ